MIEHLSAEQISEWMLGKRSLGLQQHVASCAICRAQLEQLESTLVQFRNAARDSGSSAPEPARPRPGRDRAWFSLPRLALAVAALCVLVAGPYYWQEREQRRVEISRAEDALILQRVDSSLSRSVPQPMEPLLGLMNWQSAEQDSPANTR